MLSVILGSAGVILALAITGAYLSIPLLIVRIGQFCIDAYGILAYWLPVYLFIAALLLSDYYYRPDRIFALTATILPFFTLTMGLYVINNFEQLVGTYPVLSLFGKIGIILTLLLSLLIEFFIIYWITKVIAVHSYTEKARKAAAFTEKKERRQQVPEVRLLEQPQKSAATTSSRPGQLRGGKAGMGAEVLDPEHERLAAWRIVRTGDESVLGGARRATRPRRCHRPWECRRHRPRLPAGVSAV